MRYIIWLTLSLLISCSNNDLNLSNTSLKGVFAGEDWKYKNGSGYLYSSDLKYRIRLLSEKENVEDPCTSPRPNQPHLSFIVAPIPGSYSLPAPDLQESAQFNLNSTTSYFATSGFLEIFDVSNNRMNGYIQAELNQENSIEGNFQVILCN